MNLIFDGFLSFEGGLFELGDVPGATKVVLAQCEDAAGFVTESRKRVEERCSIELVGGQLVGLLRNLT